MVWTGSDIKAIQKDTDWVVKTLTWRTKPGFIAPRPWSLNLSKGRKRKKKKRTHTECGNDFLFTILYPNSTSLMKIFHLTSQSWYSSINSLKDIKKLKEHIKVRSCQNISTLYSLQQNPSSSMDPTQLVASHTYLQHAYYAIWQSP